MRSLRFEQGQGLEDAIRQDPLVLEVGCCGWRKALHAGRDIKRPTRREFNHLDDADGGRGAAARPGQHGSVRHGWLSDAAAARISLDSVIGENVPARAQSLASHLARGPKALGRRAAMLLPLCCPTPGNDAGRRELGAASRTGWCPKKLKRGGEDPKLKEADGGVVALGREN